MSARIGPLVVVGDSLLDVDLEGEASRLCPDAPVPVVDLQRRRHRPGGAGLAALLAAAERVPVVLITALGSDDEARRLRELLDGVRVIGLPAAGGTAVKTRVAAGGVPLLRIDTGSGRATGGALPAEAREALREAAVVLVSDYGRGVTGLPELREALAAAAGQLPVVWDPHPRGAPPVAGCVLVTPNAAEAAYFGDAPGDGAAEDRREPDRLAAGLAERWCADAVAVTTGELGASLAWSDGRIAAVPVPPPTERAPAGRRLDSCGAGDRFAAAAAVALAEGAELDEAVLRAVAAASAFVRAGAAGSVSTTEPALPVADPTAPPVPARVPADAVAVVDRVRRDGGRLVATGGCFDLLHVGHVELLAAARALGDALVVCLNSDDSVRRAKGPDRPLVRAADRARVLAALDAVDAVVVFDEDTPNAIIEALRPDVWVKGSDYAGSTLPEEPAVRAGGGRVELLPVVSGYSTTELVRTARTPRSRAPDPGPRSTPAPRPTARSTTPRSSTVPQEVS